MICGKVIFKTRSEAGNQMSGMNADKRQTRSKRQPHLIYFCKECNGYHLTSKRKKVAVNQSTFEQSTIVRLQQRQTRDHGFIKIRDYTFRTKYNFV